MKYFLEQSSAFIQRFYSNKSIYAFKKEKEKKKPSISTQVIIIPHGLTFLLGAQGTSGR